MRKPKVNMAANQNSPIVVPVLFVSVVELPSFRTTQQQRPFQPLSFYLFPATQPPHTAHTSQLQNQRLRQWIRPTQQTTRRHSLSSTSAVTAVSKSTPWATSCAHAARTLPSPRSATLRRASAETVSCRSSTREQNTAADTGNNPVDFDSFSKVLNRAGGFRDPGEPEEYCRGFQVFDKDMTGFIGVGQLRYSMRSPWTRIPP
jgi:hypothetical protein